MATFGEMMRNKVQVRDNLYGDPAKLGARVNLQRRFSVNPVPVTEWELGLVDLSSVQRALDAGCGTGVFLLPLARRLVPQGATVIGLDLAEGTLGQARARVQAEGLPVDCIVGDVEALPFDDDSFDLVLANYMLYHVPDLNQAIAELRRVLSPEGTLLAATNGPDHMLELRQMEEQAFVDAGVSPIRAAEIMQHGRATRESSFWLENGAGWLSRHFSSVRLERYSSELQVTEVDPLVAYVASMWSVDEIVDSEGATDHNRAALRTRILDRLRVISHERISANGFVRITTETGAFIAR